MLARNFLSINFSPTVYLSLTHVRQTNQLYALSHGSLYVEANGLHVIFMQQVLKPPSKQTGLSECNDIWYEDHWKKMVNRDSLSVYTVEFDLDSRLGLCGSLRAF